MSVRPSVRPSVGHTRVEYLRNGPNLNKIASGIRNYAIKRRFKDKYEDNSRERIYSPNSVRLVQCDSAGSPEDHEDFVDDDQRQNDDDDKTMLPSATGALWSGTNNNRDVSNGPLGRPFACSLAPLTRSLASDCSHRSRPPLRSLVRSLAHFTHSLACVTVNDWMAIYSVFFFFRP